MNYKQVQIKNKSFGKLDGIKVYLDDSLYKEFEKTKSSTAGTFLNLFLNGKALRGLKHLLELIRQKDKNKKIIFSKTKTEKTKDEWIINFDDYKAKTSSKFYSFYRKTGLDAASFYLNQYFPEEFNENDLAESQAEVMENHFH